MFDDNTRLFIEGTVVSDDRAEPLSNIPVDVLATQDGALFNSSDSETIGFSSTGDDGRFTITTISPSNENRIVVNINRSNDVERSNPDYMELTINLEEFLDEDELRFYLDEPIILNRTN